MTEKTVGYLLLVAGLVFIAISTFSIYQVLTGRAGPVALFDSPSLSIDIGQMMSPELLRPGAQTKSELLPASELNKISNLTIHYLLMGFLVSVGFRVSTLGVQLLRPVEVKFRTKEATESKLAVHPSSSPAK